MKKLVTTLLVSVLAIFSIFTLTGCSELTDMLDVVFEKELALKENEELKNYIAELETELATLKFYNEYQDGVIGNADQVELNKVKLEVGDKEGDALTIEGSAQVTINGGIFDGGKTPLGTLGNTAVWVRSVDAKVVINDGHFFISGLPEGGEGHVELIYCKQGTVEINGGWFEGADSTVWLLNCKDEFYQDGTAKIIVKGGSFVNFDPSNCVSEGLNTNFVAEGYTVVSEVVDEGLETEYTVYTVVEVND